MIYDHRDDTHESIDVVNLYAMPNIDARYTADDIAATKWYGDYARCAVCGKSRGPFAVHHEPPRSKGSLVLCTPLGAFTVKPALVFLCERCHRDRHDRGLLKFRWVWDTPEDEERFLTGRFFIEGYREHDPRFWNHGHAVIESRGMRWKVRGDAEG